jgi:hypothetical protein
LHQDLNFNPYKIVMFQALNNQDPPQRTVGEDLLKALGNDGINHVLMTGEVNFHLCGYVNSQNCRYWAAQNPHDIHQEPLHSEKVIVWCGDWSLFLEIQSLWFQQDGNGSHCEKCNASPLQDVPSARDLTKREY